MNRIVREHYPVANLPENLRDQLAGAETVRVVIEPSEPVSRTSSEGFWSKPLSEIAPRSQRQAKADFDLYLQKNHPNVSPEEAVAIVRELRDEWDDA
jgi:hypothetical protein